MDSGDYGGCKYVSKDRIHLFFDVQGPYTSNMRTSLYDSFVLQCFMEHFMCNCEIDVH